MTVATYVEALAHRIDADWRARGHRQAAFPEVAATALAAMPAVDEIDPPRLVEAVLGDESPRRAGAHASDTVIPLFEGARFTISVHVWLDEIGQPHGHAWNGAFQIVGGPVCHALYRFDERWRHDARLRLGELWLHELALLGAGATIPVCAGATIHALCHVDRPSLSVVVRAWDEPDRQTLDYWRPGLATESGWRDPQHVPMLRCLRMVAATEPANVPGLVRGLLPRLDASGVFEVLRAALLAPGGDLEAILALAQDGPHCLGEHATTLVEALEDMLRHTAFERARARRRGLDDRFVLGALYLAEDRDRLATLAAARWPSATAWERLLAVVAGLADRTDDVLGLTAHEAATLRTRASDDAPIGPALRRHPMLGPLFAAGA